MTCPSCRASFPLTVNIRGLTICESCTASLVIATGERARAADTVILTPDELTALRKARAQVRKQRASA